MSKSIQDILSLKQEVRLPVSRQQAGPCMFVNKARGLRVSLTSEDDADKRRYSDYSKFHLRKSAQSADKTNRDISADDADKRRYSCIRNSIGENLRHLRITIWETFWHEAA